MRRPTASAAEMVLSLRACSLQILHKAPESLGHFVLRASIYLHTCTYPMLQQTVRLFPPSKPTRAVARQQHLQPHTRRCRMSRTAWRPLCQICFAAATTIIMPASASSFNLLVTYFTAGGLAVAALLAVEDLTTICDDLYRSVSKTPHVLQQCVEVTSKTCLSINFVFPSTNVFFHALLI